MKVEGKVVVVTGGANGIGRALCQRFASEGAKAVVVADIDEESAAVVAREIGGQAVHADVALERDVIRLVAATVDSFGPIDLFCANAGIFGPAGGPEVSNDDWKLMWDTNVMSHVYAARAVIPGMLARGSGYFLHTASAAGLLTQIGAAPYAVTKHAVVAFAEWLSITYGNAGIKVSCLCPQGVRTQMLLGPDGKRESFLLAGALEPEAVADAVIDGLANEDFLILPHPEVADYFKRKAGDYDRWLRGMRRLNAEVFNQIKNDS